MKIYEITIIVSGTNDKPETPVERIIVGSWEELHQLLARICREPGLLSISTNKNIKL